MPQLEPMGELDARKQTILQAVIIEYVTGAEPVGSELLVQKYSLGVKSATVRNEMAEMAELGYLEQPHTSAGRIPSDLGYRYYVDRLLHECEVEEPARQRVKGASEDGEALQKLLRDTTKVLSRLTHLLTVATTVRDVGLNVRSAMISAFGPTQALLVLVLANGRVENRMVECPAGLTLQDIGYANELLGPATNGKSLRSLTRAKAPSSTGKPLVDKLLAAIWGSLRSLSRELTRGLLITEGEEFMFAQPEFQRNIGSLSELLDQLTDTEVLYDALNAPPESGAQTVTIGRENRHQQMQQLSVVRHSFYVGDKEAGVIAIIGPTRMRYETSIPLVNYTARALSDSLTRFFG